MPFIQSTIFEFIYPQASGGAMPNHPVNLSNVLSVKKEKRTLPYGGIYYELVFINTKGKDAFSWRYLHKSDRNINYNKIINSF